MHLNTPKARSETAPARRRLAAALVLAPLLAGCSTLGYYAHTAGGHLRLLREARPIEAWLADPATPPGLRSRLQRVREIRRFAVAELGLPDNGSYTRYVALGRPFVAWNVFAAPPFSVEPLTWCFPVAGCVAYRGYFDRVRAQAEARRLAARGLDVYVGGVGAYSTLGWFADPLPSSVIHYPEAELAGLIFHELAHQRLYVRDDTAFNESFATAVALAGTRRWFAARGDPGAAARYRRDQARRRQVVALILAARRDLAALYASGRGTADLARGKAEIQRRLRRDYLALSRDWPPPKPFAGWFQGPLNNAQLASVGAYHRHVAAFEALLRRSGDLRAFYRAAARLGALAPEARAAALARLASTQGLAEAPDRQADE